MKKRKILQPLVIILTLILGVVTVLFLSTSGLVQTGEPFKLKEVVDLKETLEKNNIPPTISSDSKVLMAYVQDFRNPNDLDYSKLTHVIFSFAHPTKEGDILLNGDSALKNLETIVLNASQTNTKVMLAVGGWYYLNGEESYDYFQVAISNATTRTHLVNELIALVQNENLDGIDVDFEHPRSTEDASNLNLFVQELSTNLHSKSKEISIAVHSKINAYTGKETTFVYYDPSMYTFVDHVNIMAYDGQWDEGYHAENLSTYSFTENVVNYWTKLFDEHHLPKDKLVLGVPLYAQPEDPSVQQISYATIVQSAAKNAGNDTVNMNGTTYYFNGTETIKRKTNLALANGLGGMMLWEAGHDTSDANSVTSVIYTALEKYDGMETKN